MDPMVIIYGLFAGAVFALLGYLRQIPTDGESFQLIKALPTVILGGGIGAMLAFAGTPISEESIAIQMGVYGSLTVAIQYFVQAVYRWYTAERK